MDPAHPAHPMDLATTLRLVARYQWLEHRLFEILGAWLPSTPEAQVKRLLATQCHHHAWRAEQLGTLVPEPWQTLPNELWPPPAGDLAPFVAFADTLAALETTVERLAGVHWVAVPRLLSAYGAHLDRATPVSDAPLIRIVRLVRQDALDDWRAGEAALEALIASDPGAERAAAAAHAHLEALWPTSGDTPVGGTYDRRPWRSASAPPT